MHPRTSTQDDPQSDGAPVASIESWRREVLRGMLTVAAIISPIVVVIPLSSRSTQHSGTNIAMFVAAGLAFPTSRDGLARANLALPHAICRGPSKGPVPPATGSREQTSRSPTRSVRDPQRVPAPATGSREQTSRSPTRSCSGPSKGPVPPATGSPRAKLALPHAILPRVARPPRAAARPARRDERPGAEFRRRCFPRLPPAV